VIGFSGGVFCLTGLYVESFVLFCIGTVGTGIYTAFGHYFRFAATEVAEAGRKNTAISYVLAGGVLAAIVGPNLANYSKEMMNVDFAGTMLAVLVLYCLNAINIVFMQLPRPLSAADFSHARSVGDIARQPVYIIAVASAAIGYAVMVLLMTATPLAMTHENHAFDEVAFVIQWHVLGMFIPSFFTGHLINRFGAQKIILTGVGFMLCCLSLNLHGTTVIHFWIALTLLGIGWNFMFIGGTSLLTEAYRPEESSRAQGLNDFAVFSCAALASLGAGALLHFLSWQLVNYAVLPIILCALAAHVWLYLVRRRQPATAAN
jgi:predicted MFS family arabinose efflux permease